jgi:hypothetical protein
LESGKKVGEVQNVSPALMDIFMEVSRLCREVDAFLEKKRSITSPLLLAQLFEAGQEWSDKLLALQRQLMARHEELSTELKSIDSEWISASDSDAEGRAVLLLRLESLYRLFAYLARWSGQLQERVARIAF